MNLTLPGNPRYQPKEMLPFFGYDNLYHGLARVEVALLEVLGEIGQIPPNIFAQLNDEMKAALLCISTTEVDKIERTQTHHDVRAWVRLAQKIVGPDLARYVHVPLTSYDALDTGRMLQYRDAYHLALKPALSQVTQILSRLSHKLVSQVQIGRTHGQHALPITVGFWLATILHRLVCRWYELSRASESLSGKISGAVGAYNAQVGLGFSKIFGDGGLEHLVLKKLDLKPAYISTQILPPEPLADFLYAAIMTSASLAQLARDCRNLMRSEIGEIVEATEPGQVGSSTMAHKVNPIRFENIESTWLKSKNEFGKVLDCLISEHQRDLTNSAIARDFPIILINLQTQLNTLLRPDKNGIPYLERIDVNSEACQRNFKITSQLVMAEPLYIALQLAGYQGDGHKLVNERLVPLARGRPGLHLVDALINAANDDEEIAQAIKAMPEDLIPMLRRPEDYIGWSKEKTWQMTAFAQQHIGQLSRTQRREE